MHAGKSVPAQVRMCILQFASAGKRVGSSINPGLGNCYPSSGGLWREKTALHLRVPEGIVYTANLLTRAQSVI